jgi:hypothetical protein
MKKLEWEKTGEGEYSAQCEFGTYAYWPEANVPLDVFFKPHGLGWGESELVASVYYEEDVERDCQADYERRQAEALCTPTP